MNIQFRLMLSLLLLVKLGSFITSLPSYSFESNCSINSLDGCTDSEKLSDKSYDNFYIDNHLSETNVNFTDRIKEYFGFNGYRDQTMRTDAINLWETFELEASKQSSGPRKYSQDIPNGYDGSLLEF